MSLSLRLACVMSSLQGRHLPARHGPRVALSHCGPWCLGVSGSPSTRVRLTVGVYLQALWCCLTQQVEGPRGDRSMLKRWLKGNRKWKFLSLCRVLLFVIPWTVVHQAPLSTEFFSQGQNTGVGSHGLLQGIFPTQGMNLGCLHCRQILHHLRHTDLAMTRLWLPIGLSVKWWVEWALLFLVSFC